MFQNLHCYTMTYHRKNRIGLLTLKNRSIQYEIMGHEISLHKLATKMSTLALFTLARGFCSSVCCLYGIIVQDDLTFI